MTGRTGGTGVEGVSVTRDGSAVLRDVTLLAADGELLVVLGSSGSGKSTLLRVIAGLARADRGEVLVRGRRVTDSPPGERHVSMVFESAALVPVPGRVPQPRLGPEGAAAAGGRGAGAGDRPGAAAAAEPAAAAPAGPAVRRASAGWSASARRWSGCRTSSCSTSRWRTWTRRSGSGCAGRSSRWSGRCGVTTFYVTHDQAEALAVADRLALLHEGAVVQVGKPMELYERPVDLVVCGFVGSPPIGLLPARLVESGGLAGFEVGSRTLPLWRPVPEPLRAVRRAGGGGRACGPRTCTTRPPAPTRRRWRWTPWSRRSSTPAGTTC